MPVSHGRHARFWLQNAAGALVELTTYLMQEVVDIDVTLVELRVQGQAWLDYAVGLRDGTVSLDGTFDPVPHAVFQGLHGLQSARDWEYAPQGTSAGSPKITGKCKLASYRRDSPFDDAVGFSAVLQMTDADTTFGSY